MPVIQLDLPSDLEQFVVSEAKTQGHGNVDSFVVDVLRRLKRKADLEADDGLIEDPESIARWIAEFDAIPPLQMSPGEEAQWQVARQAQRELEKSTFNERAESLRRACE